MNIGEVDWAALVDQTLRVIGIAATDWRTFAVIAFILILWRGPAFISAWKGK